MKAKTISGHYSSVFNLAHNNRDIVSFNVDVSRTSNNYNCVVAGGEVNWDFGFPLYIPDIIKEYHKLTKLYWEQRSLEKAILLEEYWEQRRLIQWYRYATQNEQLGLVAATLQLLFLPLFIIENVKRELQYLEELRELENAFHQKELEIFLSDMMVKAYPNSIRLGLMEYDRVSGTHYLEAMDKAIREMTALTQECEKIIQKTSHVNDAVPQFATIEEIYEKVYEPSFRDFQQRQRPCRRYEGTYLDYIRDAQKKEYSAKKQSKRSPIKATSEAIEIVFGIGDMDNTGYKFALEDAHKAEALLKDYCDHLLTTQSNVCVVTSRELNTPGWQPPFKHGLLILNLTVHADEATPGIHLTCIPYSRDCKRGPAVQASMGRAMAGMGYPSTWKDALDKNGQRIPKRNKNGEIVLNKDGSVRYRQEPDKQGIIDWIEDQKRWIQQEMMCRYDWEREHKGSHPRGDLSLPEYRVARERERQAEIEKQIDSMIQRLTAHIDEQIDRLDESVDKVWRDKEEWRSIVRYLNTCSEEEYKKLYTKARMHLDYLPKEERTQAKMALNDLLITMAQKKASGIYTVKKNGIEKQVR